MWRGFLLMVCLEEGVDLCVFEGVSLCAACVVVVRCWARVGW